MLRELLRGFEARQPQSVANMVIIPLVGQDTEMNDVGTVADIYLERDRAYDRLTMGTNASNVTIIPGGYALITEESAQDRAVRSKELVAAKSKREVSAFCVQSSQGGYMSKADTESKRARMLPATVRRAAYVNRNAQGYDGLWNTLSRYNSTMGLHGDFLKTFFDRFRQQLDEFVAEFELVPHQRGAIVLINNKVVGVEIAANPMAFSAQWELLVRDCYGSEAVVQQQDVTIDETAIFSDAETLEELDEKLQKFEDEEWDYAENLVHDILSQQETCSERQIEGNLKVVDVETDDYVGQAVRENGTIIDLTLLSRDAAQKGFKFNRRRR